MKPLVYLAGPITKPDPLTNARRAARVFSELLKSDLMTPYAPQLLMTAELLCPQDYEAWMAYDFEILRRCDGLFRMPGESNGADREVEFANQKGIPVFSNRDQLYEWAKSRLKKPRRRFHAKIVVEGDEWPDVVQEMKNLTTAFRESGPTFASVSGGVSSGHIVRVQESPEMTNEKYIDGILEWFGKY